MNLEELVGGLAKEGVVALKAMQKAKDVNEKEAYSRIVKNIVESLGVFFDVAREAATFEDDDLDEDDAPF